MQDIEDKNLLAYRLREKVRYSETEGSLYLTLDYPLKVLVIHPVWSPVIRLLHGRRFVPFHQMIPLIESADPRKIESFLNGLVRKGLLETRGYLELGEYPVVSIIIPVRNRPEDLETCLQSLARLDYPSDRIETIVVDDASDDDTPGVAARHHVRLIPLKEHGQASFCRNLAARQARGEILAFLDSDCTADSLWLRELVPAFRDPSTGAVGGMVDSSFDEKGLDRYEKVRSSLNMGFWPRSSREGDLFFYIPSCNLLTKREIFRQVGGFNEDMFVGEDVDFCWRVQDLGFHIEYMPIGRVYHKHRNEIEHFCIRRFDYGTSEPFLQKTHPKRVKKFVFTLPDIFFWGSALLSIVSGKAIWLGLCVLILLTDSILRYSRLFRMKIPVRYPRLLLAICRSYIAFIYHACSFISRYYLVFIIPGFFFSPLFSAILFGAHVITTSVEYTIKKPKLNVFSFFCYFSLDQISYQAGVWWGCIRRLFFGPVNPRLVRKRVQGS